MRLGRIFGVGVVCLALWTMSCVGSDPGSEQADGNAPDGSVGTDGGGGGDDSATPACGNPNQPCCAGDVCNGGSQCNGTVCTCPVGQAACNATCVDQQTSNVHCGRCDHGCLGGTCASGVCLAYTVAPAQLRVWRMFTEGDRIYWTRASTASTGGFFQSAKLDGTDLQTHFMTAATDACYGLAAAGGKAYFLCTAGAVRTIRSCQLPGCIGGPQIVANAAATARELAADPISGTIFYAAGTPYNQAPNGRVFTSTGTPVGSANQADPVDVAVRGAYVYWLNAGTYAGDSPQRNGGLYRAPLANLPAQELVIGSGNNNYYDNYRLAVDDLSAYYTGRDNIGNDVDVVIGALGGGGALGVFASGTAYQVAADGTNVYFTGSSVSYCGRTAGCIGGTARSLSTSEGTGVDALSVDAVSVFWAKQNGEIRRIAKP